MGYIYRIVNKLNGKSYIGKTQIGVEQRFKQHIRDSRKPSEAHRPLYRAFKRYGVENFFVEMVSNVSCNLELCEKEIYYIEEFGTYKNGYNGTRGGEGKPLLFLDECEVIKDYSTLKNITKVATANDCDRMTIRSILIKNNIQIEKVLNNKKIKIAELDMEFESQTECALYFMREGITKNTNTKMVMKAINNALANNKRYKGYTFIRI